MDLSASAIAALTTVMEKYNTLDTKGNCDGNKKGNAEQNGANPVLRLRLRLQAPERHHVTFDPTVIDNENLGRRKSNCCCIYRRTYNFGESSSSSDDETENCFGHTEGQKKMGCSHEPHKKKTESEALQASESESVSTSAYALNSDSATVSFSSTSLDSNKEEAVLTSSDAGQLPFPKINTTI